ncbi:MAG TPA: hypothetical protein VL461_08735 [Dictyobacter sp.]|jgi:hypothetical protein|nr:hypothetical protein [Dictyobacter sp.]
MIQIHFHTDDNQQRWAWTEGLQAPGQWEMCVSVSWSENDARDKLISNFFKFIEKYLNSQPKRLLPQQTLRYGWSLLRFVQDRENLSGVGPDILRIEEQKNPFADGDPVYIPGIAQTLALLQIQNEAMVRNRTTGVSLYPSPSQSALICTRLTPETIQHLRPIMAHRSWQPKNPHESGWFIGCCEDNHNHNNANELTTVHLLHLVEQFPGIFPYLAMPVGMLLLFEERQAIIYRPNEEFGQADPKSLLTALP